MGPTLSKKEINAQVKELNGKIAESKKNIKGEFRANGFAQNTLKHTRGVLSMARTQIPDSASSQFFIMHKDSPHLDGQFAAFGMTVYGMDVVDAIAAVPTRNDYPTTHVVINGIRFAQKIVN